MEAEKEMLMIDPASTVEDDEFTILVIDDDEATVDFVKVVFGEDHDVISANSGKSGLNAARKHRPDLILLDVNMPNGNGFDVCQKLKSDERTKHIPVIFMTVMREASYEEKGLEAGAVDYITKPINPAIIRARVRNQLQIKRHLDTLESLSNVDGLTGIANRRRFDEHMAREWRRARRNKLELSVILIDIDYFKAFNDTYGHIHGDECLRQIAQLLSKIPKRPADLVARFGGEEFIAVLPETGLEPAVDIAEAMRQAVEAFDIPHVPKGINGHVTVSCGVATTIPNADDEPNDLIAAADKMLYQVKEQSRNDVRGHRHNK